MFRIISFFLLHRPERNVGTREKNYSPKICDREKVFWNQLKRPAVFLLLNFLNKNDIYFIFRSASMKFSSLIRKKNSPGHSMVSENYNFEAQTRGLTLNCSFQIFHISLTKEILGINRWYRIVKQFWSLKVLEELNRKMVTSWLLNE